MQSEVAALRAALRQQTNAERAIHEKRYLKSSENFLGVSVPRGHQIAKEFRRTQPNLSTMALYEIAQALWSGEYHEEKRLAVQLLDAYAKTLTADAWPMLFHWLQTAGSWDLVDETAAHLIGALIERYPEFNVEIEQWVMHENFWIRRAALVCHVLAIRHNTVPPVCIYQLCDSLMTDREYYVQKALGWVLRECAGKDPDGTMAFLALHRGKTSRLILREAVSKLDDECRRQILVGSGPGS